MQPSKTLLAIHSIVYCAIIGAYGIANWSSVQPVAASIKGDAPIALVVSDTVILPVSTAVLPITRIIGDPHHRLPVQQGTSRGSILMYHYVRSGVDPAIDPLGYRLSVTPQLLDAQLTALKTAGLKEVDMSHYRAGEGNSRTVTFTFDDGYEDFYTDAYPIFLRHNWRATLYVVSGFIGKKGYLTAPQIQELSQAGFEIGVHTVDHNDLAHQSPDAQHHEIFDSKAVIDALIGKSATAFCYPAGRFNDSAIATVKQAGFVSATTTEPGSATLEKTDWFLLPRIRVGPSQSPQILLKNVLTG